MSIYLLASAMGKEQKPPCNNASLPGLEKSAPTWQSIGISKFYCRTFEAAKDTNTLTILAIM